MMRSIYLMLISLVSSMDAYLYQAIVMRKWSDLYDRYHYVIGLGDYHIKRHAANTVQRDQFKTLLAHTNPDSIKILTEDLSACNSEGRFGCGPFYINSRGGFLGGITEMCQTFGIDVANLEFRYARVCALGPALSVRNVNKLPSVCGILVGQVCREIASECACINAFDDGPRLNAWYRSCTQEVGNQVKDFSLHDYTHKSMADYLGSKRDNRRLALVKNLLTFDSCLLDANIVHAIINNQDKERICVLAGGSHIERVSDMLCTIGYQPFLHIKSLDQDHHVLEQSVNLQVEYRDNKLPTPLDVQRLINFF